MMCPEYADSYAKRARDIEHLTKLAIEAAFERGFVAGWEARAEEAAILRADKAKEDTRQAIQAAVNAQAGLPQASQARFYCALCRAMLMHDVPCTAVDCPMRYSA